MAKNKTADERTAILEYALEHGLKAAAEHYKLARNTIANWARERGIKFRRRSL